MEIMEVEPIAYFGYEVLGGTVGGIGGGVGGFMIGILLCLITLNDNAGPLASLGCFLGSGALGYLIGTPVGATIGVSVVAGFNGIEGNVWLGLLGGTLGEGAGILAVNGLAGLAADSDISGVAYLGGVPFISALGAAIGFNVGAKFVPEATVAQLAN